MYQHGGDIYTDKNKIDFSANINFLGMPDSVRRAAQDAVADSIYYPDVKCRMLRQALSIREQVDCSHIFCGNGAADVIFSLVLAVKPKKALIPIPSFQEYQQALSTVGCEMQFFSLKEENGFRLTEDFLDEITPDIDIIFLCNPNNPTGVLIPALLLQKMLEKCEQTETLFVMDECFIDFLEDGTAYSMMPYEKRCKWLFIIKAFTKIYAMPGLRLGYGISCDVALLQKMEHVSQPWRVSVPAQAAGCAAAKEIDFVTKSQKMILQQKQKLLDGIVKSGYKIYGSAANYIFFQAEPSLGEQMKEKGFLIRDCSNYAGLETGYYRIAVRNEWENQAFLKALEEIHSEKRL